MQAQNNQQPKVVVQNPNQNIQKEAMGIEKKVNKPNLDFVVDQRLIQQCKKHVRANRVAKERECKNPQYCKCCQKSFNNERLSVFCSLKELAFLGPGVPLYFQFITTTRNILIISGLFSTYMIYQNQMEGSYCTQTNSSTSTSTYNLCFQDIYSSFSLVNLKSSPSSISKYALVQFLLTIALFFIYQVFFRITSILREEAEANHKGPEDYTAQIFNMPQGKKNKNNNYTEYPQQKAVMHQNIGGIGTYQRELNSNQERGADFNDCHKNGYDEHEIRQAIRRQYNGKLEISEVNIAYDLDEFRKGNNRTKALILLEQNRRQYCTRSSFVTFKTLQQLNIFLADHQRNTLQRFWARLCILFGGNSKKYLIFRNNLIHAEKAPAPDDVYWENISQGLRHPMKKWFYRSLTLTVNLMLILVALVCLFFVNDYKRRIKNSSDFQSIANNQLGLYGLAFLSGIIIFIINLANRYLVNLLSGWEFRQTKTHLSMAKGNKLFMVQLFNTAGVYIILYLVKYRDEMWLAGGILQDVMITHIQLAVLNPLTNIIFNLAKYLERYICLPVGQRAQKGSVEEKLLINKVLEKLQGYEFNISLNYANTLFLLFSISIYGPLMPLLYIVGFIALFLQYWTDKYHVVKRYRIPNTVSAAINDELYFIISYIPLIQILSFWFWTYILGYDTNQTFIYYGIIVSSLLILIPSKFIPKIFCKIIQSSKFQEDITYDHALIRGHFKKFYDYYNPFTHHASIERYEKIMQKQKIAKELQKGMNDVLIKEDLITNNPQMTQSQSQKLFQQLPQIQQIQKQREMENKKQGQQQNIEQQQDNYQPVNVFNPQYVNEYATNRALEKNIPIQQQKKDFSDRPSILQVPLILQSDMNSSQHQTITLPSAESPIVLNNKHLQNFNIELNNFEHNQTVNDYQTNIHHFNPPIIKIATKSNISQQRQFNLPQQPASYISNNLNEL